MVKRHKMGRRQILQLEDKKQPPTPVRPTSTKPAATALTQYSDSEDESEKSPEPASSASEAISCAQPMNTQVADFLKEIDALTTDDNGNIASSEAEPKYEDDDASLRISKSAIDSVPEGYRPVSSNQQHQTAGSQQKAPDDFYCVWQQCQDESSGYVYYWNMNTNEVTWNCPPEYMNYLKYLNSQSASVPQSAMPQPSTSKQTNNNSVKMVKKSDAIVKEGAIIPISYFGGSSSEDMSDDEEVVKNTATSSLEKNQAVSSSPNGSPVPKKITLKKPLKSRSSKRVPLGPELPPNFQFAEQVPSVASTFAPKDGQNSAEFGPQLPPNYDSSEGNRIEEDSYNTSVSVKEDVETEVPTKPTTEPTTAKEDTWEESLLEMEEQFWSMQRDRESSAEVPDSTTRKDNNKSPVAVGNASDYHPLSGLGTVAEYGSTTDDEDGVETSHPSPPKLQPFIPKPMDLAISTRTKPEAQLSSSKLAEKDYLPLKTTSNLGVDKDDEDRANSDNISSSKTNLYAPSTSRYPTDSNSPKLVSPLSSETAHASSSKMQQQKRNYAEIVDTMFSHSSDGKFGFGFNKNKQFEMEDEFTFSHCSRPKRYKSNYSMVSFVKSKSVLDLNAINNQPHQEDHGTPVTSDLDTKLAEMESQVDVAVVLDSGHVKDDADIPEDGIQVLKSENLDNSSEVKSSSKSNDSMEEKQKVKIKTQPQDEISKLHDSSAESDISSMDIDEMLNNLLKEKKLADKLKAKEACETEKSSLEPKSKPSLEPLTKPLKVQLAGDRGGKPKKGKPINIMETTNVLMDKISFLIANNSSMASLPTLLVQIQTRFMDWQAGVLNSKYFMSRLQEVQQYLQHYELGAVTGDWTCQWDRDNKRYFYLNTRTQLSQWTFPTDTMVPPPSQEIPWTLTCAPSTSTATFQTSGAQFPLVSSSISEEQLHNKSSSIAPLRKNDNDKKEGTSHSWLPKERKTSVPSPPPPPPGVDSPPLPPPPPESPPPPPPDSTEQKEDELSDMDMDSDSSESSSTFISVAHSTSTPIPLRQLFNFPMASSMEHHPKVASTSNVSSTSNNCPEVAVIMKPPQPVATFPLSDTETVSSASKNSATVWSAPICATDFSSSANTSSPSVVAKPAAQSSSQPSSVSENVIVATATASSKAPSSVNCVPSTSTKKEKKKTKLLTGLAFKKKNIPSLVQKWQKIKKEQEKEDKKPDDSKH